MIRHPDGETDRFRRITAKSAIFLSFVVALEIVIMISPFALFFYSVFNPFLLALNQSPLTRWLTAFFLPHMILPPNDALKVIRILGSVFFVTGMVVFIVCAAQVYLGKLLKKGTATGGIYTYVRHPQYLGLTFAALGLAIMWPRFVTLVLLAVMVFLYYMLAKDEERRMVSRFGEDYQRYMNQTGMFIPKAMEKVIEQRGCGRYPNAVKSVVILLMLIVVFAGGGFLLRAYTVHQLPMEEIKGIDVLTIVPSDIELARELVPALLSDSTVESKLIRSRGDRHVRVLAYFIPIDYVMQGMIADTEGEWKLYEHHKTIAMIVDYIVHPFAHLTGEHAHHGAMATMQHGPEMYALSAMKRRVIFIAVSSDGDERKTHTDDFDINAVRTPLFFADIHLHTAEILQVRDTPSGSGWGTVPTPMF